MAGPSAVKIQILAPSLMVSPSDIAPALPIQETLSGPTVSSRDAAAQKYDYAQRSRYAAAIHTAAGRPAETRTRGRRAPGARGFSCGWHLVIELMHCSIPGAAAEAYRLDRSRKNER
jgi:hypothetical protein